MCCFEVDAEFVHGSPHIDVLARKTRGINDETAGRKRALSIMGTREAIIVVLTQDKFQ